jgi:mannose-1-phosphate guanylyltransferase
MADLRSAVVMAGGVGSRLWPYSRKNRPKQLLPLLGDRTMLQATVDRLAPLVPPERVFVVTNREYVEEVRGQLAGVPAENILGEPEGFGTAPAVALGAAVIRGRLGPGLAAFLPADHSISPHAAFQTTLETAFRAAETGRIVTVGVRPTAPATGFGYLRVGAPLDDAPGAYAVDEFVEKPSLDDAIAYAESEAYFWNAGIFVWDLDVLFAEFKQYLPHLAALGEEMAAAAATPDFVARLDEIWPRITDRTAVDYGIVERSKRVACVPAAFRWDDVGSWSALAAVLGPDADGNVIVGDHIGIGSRQCIVFAKAGRLVATVGLEDVVIVDTGDAVLVCPRDRAQDVRDIVQRLREQGSHELL